MQPVSERGYIIPAINSGDVDYIACAELLAKSIRHWHPDAEICLLTDKEYINPIFNFVKILPYGDQDPIGQWKLSNDWQVAMATPFRETIKLEADMFVASPIDHWWTLFRNRDVVISQGCRNFYDDISTVRNYRRQIDINNLPDVYNAVTYWRYSKVATEFFMLVRNIFEQWGEYRTLLKFSDEYPTTDIVYAVAAQILGPERCTLPISVGPKIVHLKKYINSIEGQDWTKELIWELTNPGLRINTITQWGFVHYHIKEWACEHD